MTNSEDMMADIAYEICKIMEKRNELTTALVVVADPSLSVMDPNHYKHLSKEIGNDQKFVEELLDLIEDDVETIEDVKNIYFEEYGWTNDDWEENFQYAINYAALWGLADYFEMKIIEVAKDRDTTTLTKEECDIKIPDTVKQFARSNYEHALDMVLSM